MLTKSVKSVISVVLKHVAWAKKSVQSVRSVCYNIRMVSTDSNNFEKPCPWQFFVILPALCTFYLHYTDYQCVTECRRVCTLHTHYLHLSTISLHSSALACTAVYTLTLYLHLLTLACTLSTLTCTHFHFIYTYLHSLTFCLHALTHLLTGTSTHVF